MRIRLRAPGGQSVLSLAEGATIKDLLNAIREQASVSAFDIKYGYPPQQLVLDQEDTSSPISQLKVRLNNETLIISPREDDSNTSTQAPPNTAAVGGDANGVPSSQPSQATTSGPISLKKKRLAEDVPELPLPERGSTLVLRVMPDDNSCLFRAFGTAVLPGDDLSMLELRSLVASAIQADPDTYSKVVLEQSPDDYCRWIQTEDAWGGAIEMNILANHFDIEVCSIDVQSLRIDRFNEGRPTRCILVYSGIHYDCMVQSPSEPPHTKADNPPEFDKRIWDADDDDILIKAQELCRMLQERHYFTDTGGMAIKCNICGTIIHGEAQAQTHAAQTGHYDMGEVAT